MSHVKSNRWSSLVQLDPASAAPAYTQISRRIEVLIQSGGLSVGEILPSERTMAELLGVSRVTVQNAYNELRRRRLLLSRGRGGSVVQTIGPRITTPMNRLRGFTEEMVELGREPTARIVESGVVRDADIAAIMGAPSETPLLRLKRIRYADGVPMSKELAWYNLFHAPFLEGSDLSRSVYAALADHGLALAQCDQVIHAVMATLEDERVFGFSSATPCMLIKRRSFTAQGLMLEYVEGRFRGDLYSYRLALRS